MGLLKYIKTELKIPLEVMNQEKDAAYRYLGAYLFIIRTKLAANILPYSHGTKKSVVGMPIKYLIFILRSS